MFLPTHTTNRRTFLAHTALGAGSLLFLPELLTSCNDHRDLPIGGAQIGDYEIDWNDAAKSSVAAGLGLIPEVGEILAALVDILWPSTQKDVWEEVKDRVEALVDQKISDLVYQLVKEDLQGLNNSTTLYLNELRNGNPTSILGQWLVTRNSFAQALPHFQSKGYEVALLGLFAQFANLHLAVLRDAVINGKAWGRSDADQQQDLADLKKAISDYYNYTLATYNKGLDATSEKAGYPGPDTLKTCAPFQLVNPYERQMAFQVLDYMYTWKYYDVSQYNSGVKVLLPREIYSQMIGNCIGYNLIVNTGADTDTRYPSVPPTQGPSQITIWGGDVIDGIQVTYPAGSGPNGVTTTTRMGLVGWTGGSTQPPRGGIINISPGNPIVLAVFTYDRYPPQYRDDDWGISSVQFEFLDKTKTPVFGKVGATGIGASPFYPNHFISTIFFGAHAFVFGYQYINGGPPVTQSEIRRIYITSPNERSTADFANAFPALGLAQAPISNELKAARQAHWAAVKARAETLK